MALDSLTRGTLDATDHRMRDGSFFDDNAIDLAAGEAVHIELRGGRTSGFLCRALDVQLRVLAGEAVLPDDDDGAGGLASRVMFRAAQAGWYTVRVMAHGP